jgi:hypothetical protein
MVCFAGSGQTGCGYGERDTRPGTWSRFTAPVPGGSDVGPGGMFDPPMLAHGIAAGAWRVVGRTHLDGQQAIELSQTGRGRSLLEPGPVLLWVNAQTYLPIRLDIGTGNGSEGAPWWTSATRLPPRPTSPCCGCPSRPATHGTPTAASRPPQSG